MNKLVTTIVPVYNREDIVSQSLESVLRQTYRPIELICVDDGSQDGSLDVLREFSAVHSDRDFVVKVLRQENAGVSQARNLGLKHATGEYVQFLDSDDLYHPDKTSVCFANAEGTNADIVVPCCRGFDELEVGDILSGEINEIPPVDFEEHDLIWTKFLWGPNSPFIKRKLVVKEAGFRADLRYAEDREFFIRLRFSSNRTVRVKKRLSFFRRGGHDRLTGRLDDRSSSISRLRYQCLELLLTSRTAVASGKCTEADIKYLLSLANKFARHCVRLFDAVSFYRVMRVYMVCIGNALVSQRSASVPRLEESWHGE